MRNEIDFGSTYYMDYSPIGGLGVFAKRFIKQGEEICIMQGDIVKPTEGLDECIITDILHISDLYCMFLRAEYRYFNHSCDANATVTDLTTLKAIKDINVGEEITFNYAMTVPNSGWKMKCKCRGENDIHTVSSIGLEPVSKIRDYYNNKWLQYYMMPIVKDILNLKE
jgi:SET domain-containing protein